MSSPASSLKKAKKGPLPGSRRVPFRHGFPPSRSGSTNGSSLTPEDFRQPDHMDSSTRRHVVEEIRRHEAAVPHSQSKAKVPSDSQLLGSMATRLAAVERELLVAKREVIEKDQHISRLEERLVVLERSRSGSQSDSCLGELELKCLALQKQVDEMEEFLNDYGMVWVGIGANGHDEGTALKSSPDHHERGGGGLETGGDVWMPHASRASLESSLVHVGGCPFQIDFDCIIKNIKELNVLAGEGTAQVEKVTSGAKLKAVEPIPLTLFKNGLVMFQGPFRPYTDYNTQQCVLDLTDGYFPSELQERFPDGVPFQVSDQRDIVFRVREYQDYFPGSGHSLGGRRGPSKLLPSATQQLLYHGREPVGNETETSELPGPKLTMETFLSRLPASVIRGGRVIDIRSGIAGTLQGCDNSASVTLVETPVLQEIKSRLDLTEDLRPPTPGHVTTLRVKSVAGNKTYILKMKYSDTIGDVRSHISRLQGTAAPPDFQLKTSFPPQTFANPLVTLSDCGLVPSANLFMARTRS